MANVQVKNLPDELHEKLRERARSRHVTVSALLTELIEVEVAGISTDQWLEEIRKLPMHPPIDIAKVMAEVKDEIEGH